MAMTGTKDVHPVKFGPRPDYATGMTGAFALSRRCSSAAHRARSASTWRCWTWR
jgi:hypothetical protein